MVALQPILERALAVAGEARSSERKLNFQLMALRDSPETALSELRDLLSVIEGTEALQVFGYSSYEGFHSLISWLISRSQQVGAKQAIEDLTWYLNTSFVDASLIIGLDGIQVAKRMKFGEYELVAWGDLELSDTKWTAGSRSGSKLPCAALSCRYRINRSTIQPPLGLEYLSMSGFEPAHDLLRCVGLVSGAGIRLLNFWVEPEARAPLAVALTHLGIDSTVFSRFVDVEQVSQLELERCFQAFEKLDNNQKIRLRLPLDRLNKSFLSATNPVASAIELGIALESLFVPYKLSKGRGISYAIRTRAANWLGGAPENREQAMATLKDVYDLRSRAIHAGRFDADDEESPWLEPEKVSVVLNCGRRIVAVSLLKVVLDGEPNWEDFDLAAV